MKFVFIFLCLFFVNQSFSSDLPTPSNYERKAIGYAFGVGIIQNTEKAIDNYRLCAFEGQLSCMESLFRIYYARWDDNRAAFSDLDIEMSMAWAKILLSRGEVYLRIDEKREIRTISYINITQNYLSAKEIKESNQFANYYCSKIPGCKS